MPYDSVGFLNTSLAILIGIGVALALFATFFPETSAQAGGRFRRQLLVGLSRLAGARHPAIHAYEGALYERLGTTLGRLKDEPNAVRGCLAGAMTALSTACAIDGLRTAIGVDRLPPAMAADISSLLGHISWAYLHPCRASLTKSAWEARALRCRSLAMARAASDPEETEALAAVLVGCEALRSTLLKTLILLPEKSDVR